MKAGAEVHVWRAGIDLSAAELEAAERTLAPGERERAARYRFSRDRRRAVAGRARLRTILARYLHCDARAVKFSYGRYGKPALADGCNAGDVRFNFSRAGGLAVCAVSWHREVGIDVERAAAPAGWGRVAEQFYTPGEARRLRALPEREAEREFIACWTRKEAYGKARGEGLAMAFADRDIPVSQPQLEGWTVRSIPIADGFCAALAVEGQWPEYQVLALA
ncbi:MAG: 4'-phosphopantetheinyl transferase family protein [Terriglobales bacterium]